MSPSADHEGYRIGPVDATTTVVVVGAGPSGLMLAYVNLLLQLESMLTVSKM